MAEEQKKRKGRKNYLEDFRPAADGSYVYTGAVHRCSVRGADWRRELLFLWGFTLIAAVSVVAAGCVPCAGTRNSAWVILPYTGALVSEGSVVWLMGRLTHGGEELRDYVYRATVEQYKPRAFLVLVFSAVTLLGDGIDLVLRGPGEHPWGSAAFLALMALALTADVLWLRRFNRLHWQK